MPEGVDLPNTKQTGAPETKEREGLRMNFRIDNHHLISHTLASIGESQFSSSEHREDIVAFKNYAWGQSERCYGFVAGRIPAQQFFASGGTMEEITRFLAEVEQSGEFGKIRQQTEAYLVDIQEEWDRNYPQASQAVREMTGLDLNKELTINVTHPSLKNGQYLGNNTIAWGHTAEWNNYNTVYLWHELLHSYFDYTDLSHSLVQLVADNELRTRLNPGETYPPFVGHEDLFPLMDNVLPHWRAYLAEIPTEGKKDILGFEEKLRAMPEFKETSQEKSPATPIIE